MPHRGNQPAGQKEKAAIRRVRVLELRAAGAQEDRIASMLGCAKSTVSTDIARAMAEKAAEQSHLAGEVRAMQLLRYETLLLYLAPQTRAGHLGAIGRATTIIDSICRLLGVNAPTAVEHAGPGGGPIEVADAGRTELLGRLARLAASAATGSDSPGAPPA